MADQTKSDKVTLEESFRLTSFGYGRFHVRTSLDLLIVSFPLLET
jgi:hypothetical protein